MNNERIRRELTRLTGTVILASDFCRPGNFDLLRLCGLKDGRSVAVEVYADLYDRRLGVTVFEPDSRELQRWFGRYDLA